MRVAKTVSKSSSVLACTTWRLSQSVRAAACTCFVVDSAIAGLPGFIRRAMVVAVGTSSCSTSSCFGPSSTPIEVAPVMLPPGLLRLATSPSAIRIARCREDDGYRGGCRFGSERCRMATGCGNHGHLSANQIGRQCRQSIVLVLRPAILDRDVVAFDIANFVQPLTEPG